MKTTFIAGLVGLLSLMSFAARADNFVGGSYARVRQNGGPFDGSANGYKFFVGQYNRTVGLEGGWINFGHLGGSGGPHADAWTSALMLGFPISSFTAFGKGGLALSRVGPTPTTEGGRHYRFYYGGGVRFGGNKGLGVRAEYERFRLDADHVELLTGGLEYRF